MKFKYGNTIGQNSGTWAEFNAWQEQYANENPQEFTQELYHAEKFQLVGSASDGHGFRFTPPKEMPFHIAEAIRAKLLELWPE